MGNRGDVGFNDEFKIISLKKTTSMYVCVNLVACTSPDVLVYTMPVL